MITDVYGGYCDTPSPMLPNPCPAPVVAADEAETTETTEAETTETTEAETTETTEATRRIL